MRSGHGCNPKRRSRSPQGTPSRDFIPNAIVNISKGTTIFRLPMTSVLPGIANPLGGLAGGQVYRLSRNVSPLSHTTGFSGSALVHSEPGGVINARYRSICPDLRKDCADRLSPDSFRIVPIQSH